MTGLLDHSLELSVVSRIRFNIQILAKCNDRQTSITGVEVWALTVAGGRPVVRNLFIAALALG
ncbi:Uncharacterised protein [Vibrio cholerae]|nr:Uncharacterised protein [Vibrio cholerae]CSI72951.1 Uncharacterised protein [Vibrio cholerae]